MSEKLSDRLKANSLAYELLGEHDLPALLREAARIVRAVEDAPTLVFHCVDEDWPDGPWFVATPKGVGPEAVCEGKPVKLIEVK